MKETIKGVRLNRTEDRLVIFFELHDGTDIVRSEQRLLEELGYDPDPRPLDKVVIEASLLRRYRESVGDDHIFTMYMMYHASNCRASQKTIAMKNGDIVLMGRKPHLRAFKKWEIEGQIRDK